MESSTNSSNIQVVGEKPDPKGLILMFNILVPAHFMFGLLGNSLSFGTLRRMHRKLTKVDKSSGSDGKKKSFGLVYQLLNIINDLMALTVMALTLAGQVYLSVLKPNAPELVRKSFMLRWFFGKVSHIPNSAMITHSLLFMVWVCEEKLTALRRPLAYKVRNHKKRAAIVWSACLMISILTSIPEYFKFDITQIGDDYFVIWGSGVPLFAIFHPSVRMLCLCLIAIYSFLIISQFRKMRRTQNSLTISESKSDETLHEYTLGSLLLTQVLLCFIGYAPRAADLFLRNIIGFTGYMFLSAFFVMLSFFAVCWNFIFYILISKKFRTEFKAYIKSCCGNAVNGENIVEITSKTTSKHNRKDRTAGGTKEVVVVE